MRSFAVEDAWRRGVPRRRRARAGPAGGREFSVFLRAETLGGGFLRLDDGVRERSDPIDFDMHDVSGMEGEGAVGDDPGARHQEHAVGKWLSRISQAAKSSKPRAP